MRFGLGSASLLLSERAKFVEKLKEEKFSNPVLAKISFEIEDDNPQASKLIGLDPEDKLQSRLLFNAGDWREDPKTVASAIKIALGSALKILNRSCTIFLAAGFGGKTL